MPGLCPLGRNPVLSLQLRLYFSRDGGFTWFEVDRYYWQFQFAGQGAIVAAIRMYTLTSSVRWSCDEGYSWQDVSFLDANSTAERIIVIGMLTEFGEKALHVTYVAGCGWGRSHHGVCTLPLVCLVLNGSSGSGW